jgi:hypothetical protein
MNEWGLSVVEWKKREWLNLGSGVARKKLVDPTECHGVAVVRMETELEKEVFEGVVEKIYQGIMGARLLVSVIRVATAARIWRQRGHPLNTESSCFER